MNKIARIMQDRPDNKIGAFALRQNANSSKPIARSRIRRLFVDVTEAVAVNLFSYRITSAANVFAVPLFCDVSLLRKVNRFAYLNCGSCGSTFSENRRGLGRCIRSLLASRSGDERQCDDTDDKPKNAEFCVECKAICGRKSALSAWSAKLAPTVKVKKMTPAYWTSDLRVCTRFPRFRSGREIAFENEKQSHRKMGTVLLTSRNMEIFNYRDEW